MNLSALDVQVAPFCRALLHHFRQQIFGEYPSIHRIFATKTGTKLLRQIRFNLNIQRSSQKPSLNSIELL